jgi:hypothetical protein
MKIYLLILTTILLFIVGYQIPATILAQTSSACPGGFNPIRVTGADLSLFTLGSNTNLGKYSVDGRCIVGSRATIPSFGIPSYDDLKSLFFTQAAGNANVTKHTAASSAQDQSFIALNAGANRDHLYAINGDLTINSAILGGELGVIFVDGNLNIRSNITQPAPNKGIVFIVKGNMNISSSVTQINAVLINYAVFCSAYDFTANTCPANNVTAPQLAINGSVIFLNTADRVSPSFVRDNSSSGNGSPAETLTFDPKYLVVLKNVMTRNLTVWKEVP